MSNDPIMEREANYFAMSVSEQPITTKCPCCGEPVTSYWLSDNAGCVSKPEYCLVADWVFHAACWDKMVESYNQAEIGSKGTTPFNANGHK